MIQVYIIILIWWNEIMETVAEPKVVGDVIEPDQINIFLENRYAPTKFHEKLKANGLEGQNS